MSVELCVGSARAFIFKTQTWQKLHDLMVSTVSVTHLYRHYGGSRTQTVRVRLDFMSFLIFLPHVFSPWNKWICLTCKARFRLLTNTVSNRMSLRYCPTASPCCRPVSDRTVSTPCPERQTGWFNAHVDQSPVSAGSRKCEFYLADAFPCCTVFPHWVNIKTCHSISVNKSASFLRKIGTSDTQDRFHLRYLYTNWSITVHDKQTGQTTSVGYRPT